MPATPNVTSDVGFVVFVASVVSASAMLWAGQPTQPHRGLRPFLVTACCPARERTLGPRRRGLPPSTHSVFCWEEGVGCEQGIARGSPRDWTGTLHTDAKPFVWTAKRRVFLEEYLRCWNATEAARRAEYKHPNVQGPTLVKLSAIADAIQERIAQKAMSADEVLLRLAEQARAIQAQYLQPDGTVDLERLIQDGYAHLVKGTHWDRNGNLTIDFHDAQSALVHLGRHLGVFVDKLALTDPSGSNPYMGLSDDDLRRALLEAATRAAPGGGEVSLDAAGEAGAASAEG